MGPRPRSSAQENSRPTELISTAYNMVPGRSARSEGTSRTTSTPRRTAALPPRLAESLQLSGQFRAPRPAPSRRKGKAFPQVRRRSRNSSPTQEGELNEPRTSRASSTRHADAQHLQHGIRNLIPAGQFGCRLISRRPVSPRQEGPDMKIQLTLILFALLVPVALFVIGLKKIALSAEQKIRPTYVAGAFYPAD